MDALDVHTRALSIGSCPRGGGAEAESCGYAFYDRGRWCWSTPEGVVRQPTIGFFQRSCRILGPLAPGVQTPSQSSSFFIELGKCEFVAQPLRDLAFTDGSARTLSVA